LINDRTQASDKELRCSSPIVRLIVQAVLSTISAARLTVAVERPPVGSARSTASAARSIG
jgi:hypothetical protein